MPPMPKKANGEWYSQAELDGGWAVTCQRYAMRSQASAQARFGGMGMGWYPGW